ncbi:MAG: VCBS repeat-containing protein [Planctomycetes bacterium]|nr:VCBS repeat-containing protein [Planctomycetota bacterium]
MTPPEFAKQFGTAHLVLLALLASEPRTQRFIAARFQPNLTYALGQFSPFRDVDLNGGPEFVFTSYLHPNSSELTVTWNDGSGMLGPVSRFPAHASTVGWTMTYPLIVADIDGDGRLDVVSGTMGGVFTNPRLRCPCPVLVFMGLGNHQFVGEPFGRFGGVRLPGSGYGGAADLNGDGAIDFLFYDSGPKVFLNDGTGRFAQLPNAFPPGVFGGQFRFADLDGDGDLDYVATGASSTAAGVCLNDGTGHFPQQFLLTTSGLYLETLDVDLDGDQDVAFLFPNVNALPPSADLDQRRSRRLHERASAAVGHRLDERLRLRVQHRGPRRGRRSRRPSRDGGRSQPVPSQRWARLLLRW